MTAALAYKQAAMEAAYRRSAALTAAVAAGKHNCWCEKWGSRGFGFGKDRVWFCFEHRHEGERLLAKGEAQ